jgi:hypothetical protein
MDSGSIIIAAILLAICIMPFVMMSINRQKREKQMLTAIMKIAGQHNCKVAQHECCGNFIIGIDETKNVVFFYQPLKDSLIEKVVNLGEIQECEVINSSRSFGDGNGYYQVIDKLNLSFTPIARNGSPIVLNFYDAEQNVQLSGELQSIEKWGKRINQRLQNMN